MSGRRLKGHVVLVDRDVPVLVLQSRDQLLVSESIDVDPDGLRRRRGEELVDLLDEEVAQRLGERLRQHHGVGRQRLGDAVLEVGDFEGLVGHEGADGVAYRRILGHGRHRSHPLVGVEDEAVGPEGQSADHEADHGHDDEDERQPAPQPRGAGDGGHGAAGAGRLGGVRRPCGRFVLLRRGLGPPAPLRLLAAPRLRGSLVRHRDSLCRPRRSPYRLRLRIPALPAQRVELRGKTEGAGGVRAGGRKSRRPARQSAISTPFQNATWSLMFCAASLGAG